MHKRAFVCVVLFFLGEVGKGLEKVLKIEQIFSVTESIPAGENFPVVTKVIQITSFFGISQCL